MFNLRRKSKQRDSSSVIGNRQENSSSRQRKLLLKKPAWDANTSVEESPYRLNSYNYQRDTLKPEAYGLSRIRQKQLKKQLQTFENRPFTNVQPTRPKNTGMTITMQDASYDLPKTRLISGRKSSVKRGSSMSASRKSERSLGSALRRSELSSKKLSEKGPKMP